MADPMPTDVGNVDNHPIPDSDRTYRSTQQRATLATVVASMAALSAYFITTAFEGASGSDGWLYVLVPALTLVPVVGTILSLLQRGERERHQEDRISRSLDDIKKDPSDFGALLEFNRGLIEKYHLGTRRRAMSSFWAGLLAMAVGLGVLIYGAIAVFQGSEATELNTNQRVVAATFAAVAGAVASYVARTFMLAHSRALDDLSAYFRQPLVTSYLLAAERIAADLSKGRTGEITERERTSMEHLNGVISRTLAIAEQEARRQHAAPVPLFGPPRLRKAELPSGNGSSDGTLEEQPTT